MSKSIRNLSATEKTHELPRPNTPYRILKRGKSKSRRSSKIADPVVVIIEQSPVTYLRKKNTAKKIRNSLLSSYRIKKGQKELEKQSSRMISNISKSIRNFLKGGGKSKRKTIKISKIE